MANVQLSGEEVTRVWVSVATGRIVGFCPVWLPGMGPCRCIELTHAHEINTWANRFREQQRRDYEEKQYAQLTKDDVLRKRIREALRARRNVVGPLQRADIDRGLRMLDALEAKIAARSQEGALLIERYDSAKRQEDIALEAPVFQKAN
jgi:hypothetical protein